jgi:hypothetical protein
MKRQTAAQEADLPEIFNKTWQAENPDYVLCRTRQTSACHGSSPSGLPTNCGAPFSTLPESRRFIFVLTCLSSIAMGTKGFCWEPDGNKRNLMGIFWELGGNKGIFLRT